jgi:hypothetical protein
MTAACLARKLVRALTLTIALASGFGGAFPIAWAPTASAQDSAEPAPIQDMSMMPRAARRAREASLVAVLAARRQAEAELRALQKELLSDAGRGREADLEREIQARASEVARLARSFSELATGIDPVSLDADPEPARFELSQELRVLLAPLIGELKRATSRPREIDRLRTEIADIGEQSKTIDKALAQLDAVEKAAKSTPELTSALTSERKDWLRRQATLATALEVAQQKLDQRASESQSIGEAVRELFQVFFKSRGRNLLLAFFATASFLFLLRRFRTFIAARPRFARREHSFGLRVANLAYSIFSVVGAFAVFVVALYFFGDWVLLILALLLILGIVWASKQAVPRFWSQAILFLDMGAVREGQRVVRDGLPWRVESIAFYCVLVNPALVGGRIRIPIEDVASMRSRPDREDEPFFPTREGDVVLLSESRPARVELQSTEIVRLRLAGGNRIVMPTLRFLSEPIEILSQGYRVDLQFGLDYQGQSEITTTTRTLLESEVERRWQGTPWASSLVGVAVEFSAAGPSSLDYFVRVDLDGTQAIEWAAQRRHLARICVDVCNENGWVIPFSQLTVHVANPDANGEAPQGAI